MSNYTTADGEQTRSGKKYADSWAKRGAFLRDTFGMTIIGYDPDVLVKCNGAIVALPLPFVNRLMADYAKREEER